MIRIVLADLRHSWRIWIGALILLAVIQTLSTWIGAMALIGVTDIGWAHIGADLAAKHPDPVALTPLGLASATISCGLILAIVMIGTVRGVATLVVSQRRRLLALWQLSGMTDAQSGRILNLQFVALGLVATVFGLVIGAATIGGVIGYVGDGGLIVPGMSTAATPLGMLLGIVVGLVVIFAGAAGAGREIRSVRPIEAIQGAGTSDLRMTPLRWIVACALLALAVFLYVITAAGSDYANAGTLLLIGSLLFAFAVAAAGPLTVMGFLRAWSALVPRGRSVSWFLARSALQAASARVVASVVPVAVSVVLIVGLYSINDSTNAAVAAAGRAGAGDDPGLFSVIALVGLPIIVSVVGAGVLVFMAGLQREKEIALGALAGATPRQQILQAVFEAVIVVVTGVVTGMVGVLLGLAALQGPFHAALGVGGLAISWGPFGLIAGMVLVVNLLATIVPTAVAQGTANLRLVAAT
ncbi:MAG: hypothetical protein JWN36_1655 [Microbacteriaceae bacterium]|nr:hypothetical protein [Microbacteriaceae bacterium]